MNTNGKSVTLELHTEIDDHGELETSTTRQTGTLFQRENKDVLTFEEVLEEGPIVKNLITIQADKVSVKRTGPISMHQQLDVTRITENVLQHPHGNIHMETTTNAIDYQPLNTHTNGLLRIYYTVKLNGQDGRKHTLTLMLKEEALWVNTLAQTEDTLKQAIMNAILQADLATEAELPAIHLEKPKEKAHGDFATNIAMQLARIAKKAPRQIAEDIVANMDNKEASVEKVEIAGPGFINFFMKDNFLGDLVPTILDAGSSYGQVDTGSGKKVQVEFVSVNPTGDLHLGHARGAAFGDVLCNVLEKAGYQVDREYYINDAGNQIDNLALSVEARYMQALGKEAGVPEAGYHGEDIVGIGKTLVAEYGDKWVSVDEKERLSFFKDYGLRFELNQIKEDLQDFRVHFDTWFSEASLYDDNKVAEAVEKLKAAGVVYESDGATWLRSTDYGDDKDRVLIKKNGDYTYLTPDIAYHKNKFDRGYDNIINVWGADHHGYIPRMRAAVEALGYPVEKFDVSVIQMVSLLEEGASVRMSKRAGTTVSLRELMDEVGVDAVRYYFVMRSNESQLDFDMDLARSTSNDNPVYYVQYAHARICTMLKLAESRGFGADQSFDPEQLTAEKEIDILKKLAEFPQVVADAAEKRAPHKITQYVFDVAAVLHSFYNAEKVLNEDDIALTSARIALMKAVRVTIANALKLLGVGAPVKM